MHHIVAIGGGSLADGETWDIDRRIVQLTGTKHPRAVFLPTASDDRESYCLEFEQVYGRKLGCRTDVLRLRATRPSAARIERTIARSDLIYVGGGNTLKMMMTWRRLGVDALLESAGRRGAVLSGSSAGANCWFRYGCSDSRKFTTPEDWTFIRVRGLGLIDAVACPHYHVEHREKPFENIIRAYGGVGIALDNNAALELVGDRCRVIRSDAAAKAYRLYKQRGTIVTEPIHLGERAWSLGDLIKT